MNKAVELTSETTVVGYFEQRVEIIFSVGDCARKNGNIVVSNIRKIDEENPDLIPTTLSLCDGRLNLEHEKNQVSKTDIRNYFNAPVIVREIPSARKVKKNINTRRGNYALN